MKPSKTIREKQKVPVVEQYDPDLPMRTMVPRSTLPTKTSKLLATRQVNASPTHDLDLVKEYMELQELFLLILKNQLSEQLSSPEKVKLATLRSLLRLVNMQLRLLKRITSEEKLRNAPSPDVPDSSVDMLSSGDTSYYDRQAYQRDLEREEMSPHNDLSDEMPIERSNET